MRTDLYIEMLEKKIDELVEENKRLSTNVDLLRTQLQRAKNGSSAGQKKTPTKVMPLIPTEPVGTDANGSPIQ